MFLTIKLCTYAKLNLALNNLQRLICHKTKPNQSETSDSFNSINNGRVKVLSLLVILTYCLHWTCNLPMISLKTSFQPNTLSTALCVQKAEEHISRNVVSITIKIIMLCHRYFDKYYFASITQNCNNDGAITSTINSSKFSQPWESRDQHRENQEENSLYIPIANWSYKTYSLFHSETGTTTTGFDLSDNLHG